jgi:hypothetical protein
MEPQAGLEPQSEIMMLQDKFIAINPSGATIYVGIFDGKLVNFRWSEFEALATAADAAAARKAVELKTGNEEQRLIYFNSPEFKTSGVFNAIKSSTDSKAIANDDIFDFDIITDRGRDRERPTQYAWKMGNYCEENTQGPESHNIAAAICGDPITGRIDEVVGGSLSDSICKSKIDHAVHIKESFNTRVSELKLDNYQLLDEPLYDGSPPGTHPSDHSAICFDIICTTDLMTEYYGGKFRGLETNYASFYNLGQSPPETDITPDTEIIDICGSLISWNAEGFCGVLPFLLIEEVLKDLPSEVNRYFSEKIRKFKDKNREEMGKEVLTKKIQDFYIEMRPSLAALPVGFVAAFLTSGILPAIGVAASGVATAAGVERLTGAVEPGGYWRLNDWEKYIWRFNHKNCKILMIQELFLKDFLGMVEIRDNMDEIVQYIARYIITILSGGDNDKWRYQWDGYTGCVFWDSSVYELDDSLSIIRKKEAIRRGRMQSEPTVLNHGGVWEYTKTKLEEEGEGDKFSTYFKFKLIKTLHEGESFLNVTNIHLKAPGVGPAPDHAGELRNILNKIKSNARRNARPRPKDHYLIGDFNNKDIKNLIMDVSLESVFRDPRCIERWYKTTGMSSLQGLGNTGVAVAGAAAESVQQRASDAVEVVAGAAESFQQRASDVASSLASGMTGLAQGLGFGRGGGKKRKSTRRKRKSNRRKHKKTHKKSKSRKSYKKKRKTKRK